MKILVTDGAGFIDSNLVDHIPGQRNEVDCFYLDYSMNVCESMIE